MKEIAREMAQIRWTWADKDREALRELERRIARAGRRRTLISYSELATGVEFRLPNLNLGQPYQIDVSYWKDLDRALIGEFLGYLSTQSYRRYGFVVSALVVEKEERKPSYHFFEWMRKLGAVPNTTDEVVLPFWVAQVNLAYEHYVAQPRSG